MAIRQLPARMRHVKSAFLRVRTRICAPVGSRQRLAVHEFPHWRILAVEREQREDVQDTCDCRSGALICGIAVLRHVVFRGCTRCHISVDPADSGCFHLANRSQGQFRTLCCGRSWLGAGPLHLTQCVDGSGSDWSGKRLVELSNCGMGRQDVSSCGQRQAPLQWLWATRPEAFIQTFHRLAQYEMRSVSANPRRSGITTKREMPLHGNGVSVCSRDREAGGKPSGQPSSDAVARTATVRGRRCPPCRPGR